VARLRVIHVPPLCQRTADIPSIFDALMKRTLEKFNLPPDILKPYLATDYYEALCLDGFFDNNARGIISIADHIASTIALGVAPAEAVAKVFVKRFSDGLVVRRRADDNKYKAEKVTMHSPNKRDPETVSASLSTSHYELHKSYIISVFKKSRGNVAETHRRLHDTGIKCSRRWLDIFLDKWGVERRRYASRKRKSHIGES
jgi:DNA-binding NtrC family response regulator